VRLRDLILGQPPRETRAGPHFGSERFGGPL